MRYKIPSVCREQSDRLGLRRPGFESPLSQRSSLELQIVMDINCQFVSSSQLICWFNKCSVGLTQYPSFPDQPPLGADSEWAPARGSGAQNSGTPFGSMDELAQITWQFVPISSSGIGKTTP